MAPEAAPRPPASTEGLGFPICRWKRTVLAEITLTLVGKRCLLQRVRCLLPSAFFPPSVYL